MIDNPYATKVFINTWFKHFDKAGSRIKIKDIEGTEFYQSGSGLYINSGETHTKGIYYSMTNEFQIKNKTLLIHDVPSYFNCPKHIPKKSLRLKKIRQYPGFLIELEGFDSLGDFMLKKFKKSSRYKLNKYKKRLTQCFDIQYKMFTGEIAEKDYHTIFKQFRTLLEKRFEDKGEHNNNLDKQEWEFYKKVVLPMIKESKAGLFVIQDHGMPIAITLVYFSKDIIFDAITVFDIDYSKFHLGSVNIMFLIEWGIAKNYKILDFSKGYFDYKVRWSTKKYDFEYHILYNPKSTISRTKAFFLTTFFKTKQYLRDKGINRVLNKVRFALKNSGDHKPQKDGKIPSNPIFEDYDVMDAVDIVEIDRYDPKIKKVLFDFLYLYGENSQDVNIFKLEEKENQFLLKGKKTSKIISLT
ncbi:MULTISPECIES: GNAT family N-acetyltransferase [unclassified Flagellimonas]|uniref:GNAT family N-acetyltransferase n=1 Tax=Flagellimonas sp. MMG031 TaxID=3158549 RepID=A0AAU7MWF5_9FLAO